MPKIMSWDWSEGIDLEELSKILLEFGIVLVEVKTGCDAYSVVVEKAPFSKESAQAFYDGVIE